MNLMLMAFVLACEVIIGKYKFTQVNEVRTNLNWRELGNTCEIRLPKHVLTEDKIENTLDKVLKAGDAVSVKLWYTGYEAHEEFNGYVKRINPNIPTELECEDHVYFFRKTPIRKSWTDTTLKEVVQYLVSEVNKKHPSANITASGKLPDVTLKPFIIETGCTAATALQTIKENYGLVSYFRGRELYTGLAYGQTFGDVRYSLAWNVIFHELKYRDEDDVLLKVKAIGIQKENTKVSVEVGDEDGEQRTLHFYNVDKESELKKLAEEELKRLKFTGYEGDLTTFGYPYAEPLMVADLRDPEYGESRSGRYVIDSVKCEFGAYGWRREVELGIKLTV